jgi:hypothetical protein
MAAASAVFCPCRRSRYQVLTSIPKPAIPKKPTADAANIKALTPRLSRKQSKTGKNLVALAIKDHTMVTTSTAVAYCFQSPVRIPERQQLEFSFQYETDAGHHTSKSFEIGPCHEPLTKRKELTSTAMLRNWNSQGSCAEAGLLRKECGTLGPQYAGRV